MAAILNSAILNLAILDLAILVFPVKLTHTCQDWFPPFAQKKPSLILSDSTWWWKPSWILPCWIQTLPSWIQRPSYLLSDSLQNTLPPLWLLTQTNSIWLTWWWQASWILPSWILPSWIQPLCTKLWLKLIQSDSNSFILTQLDDGSHLEFCHLEFGNLGFSHLSFPLKLTHTCQDWFPPFAQKKTSLILSDSTWWWQPSWILPCWIQTVPFWIQTPCFLLSDSLKNTLPPL